MQRFRQRGGKSRCTIHAGKLAAETERRLQFHYARGGSLGFLEPPELRERRRQQHVRDTVSWIELDRLVGSLGRFLIAAALEVAECERMAGGPRPRIEWTQPQRPLAPFNRALGFSRPSEDNAADDIGQSRRRADG